MQKFTLKNDCPIKTISEDLLSRKNFVAELHNQLLHLLEGATEESATVGILGKWGDGKTSVINLCLSELRKNYKNKLFLNLSIDGMLTFLKTLTVFLILITLYVEYIKNIFTISPFLLIVSLIIILKMRNFTHFFENLLKSIFYKVDYREIHFNPWSYDNDQQIIEDFLKTLAKEFSMINLSMLLKKYAKCFLNKEIDNRLGFLIENCSIKDLHEQIKEYFKNSNKKVVVILDDIDRMNAKEIEGVFKLVRKVANFPNFLYILAYDKVYVENEIAKSGRYIEKIINRECTLPPITDDELQNIFNDNLDSIIGLDTLNYDRDAMQTMYFYSLRYYITNIRQEKRLLNEFQMHYKVFSDVGLQINVIDLLLLTAIKVFNPNLYKRIHLSRNIFEHDNDASIEQAFRRLSSKNNKDFIWEDIEKGELPSHEEDIFVNGFGAKHFSKFDTKRFNSDLANFDLYFNFNPPKSDLTKILKCLDDFSNCEEEFDNIERTPVFYSDLSDIINSKQFAAIRDEKFLATILYICLSNHDIMEQLSGRYKGIFNPCNELFSNYNLVLASEILYEKIDNSDINDVTKIIYDLFCSDGSSYWDRFRKLAANEEKIRADLIEKIRQRYINSNLVDVKVTNCLVYGFHFENEFKNKMLEIFEKEDEKVLEVLQNLLTSGTSSNEPYYFYSVDSIKALCSEVEITNDLKLRMEKIKQNEAIMQNNNYIDVYSSIGSFEKENIHLVDAILNLCNASK